MNILIAENDPDYRNVLADLLETNGHRVFKAADGQNAYRLLHYFDIDMIISDIAMPVLSGDQFHDKIRKDPCFQWIPFIYISGYPQLRAAVKIENHELDFCLSKLGPIQEFTDIVREIVGRLKKEETNQPGATHGAHAA